MENKNYNKVANLNLINRSFQAEFQKEGINCHKVNQFFTLDQNSPIEEYHELASQIADDIKKKSHFLSNTLKKINFPVLAKIFDTMFQIVYVFLYDFQIEKNDISLFKGYYFKQEESSNSIYLSIDLKKMSAIFPYNDSNWQMIYFNLPVDKIITVFELNEQFSDANTAQLIDLFMNLDEKKLKPIDMQYNPELTEKIVKIEQLPCLKCDKFSEHSKTITQKKKIELEIEKNFTEIEQIENKVGSMKFKALMSTLKELNFIDKLGLATEKMKIAKAVCAGPEVVLFTELISNNLIHELDYIEIPVILCLLDLETKKKDGSKSGMEIISSLDVSEELKTKMEKVNETWVNIKIIEQNFGIVEEEFLNFEMAECIYNWMSGFEFKRLIETCEKVEGHILRTIYKIEKFLEKLKVFAETFDQKELKITTEKSLSVIRRDILNVPSLYLTYSD